VRACARAHTHTHTHTKQVLSPHIGHIPEREYRNSTLVEGRCQITDCSSGRESGRKKEVIEELVMVGEGERNAARWDRKIEVVYDALESRES
jgi:hypothetical protein